MREIVKLRDRFSKRFSHGHCKRELRVSRTPIHYQGEDGEWYEFDTTIMDGRVDYADYSGKLLEGKIGYAALGPDGKRIEVELLDGAYSDPEIGENIATYVEALPGVDLVLTFQNLRIKVERVLKTASSEPNARYRTYRENGSCSGVVNEGFDDLGRKVRLKHSERPGSRQGEKIVEQIFDGYAMSMDKATRVRKWSESVAYPVRIDPTTIFEVARVE